VNPSIAESSEPRTSEGAATSRQLPGFKPQSSPGEFSLQSLTRQSVVNMTGGIISQALKFFVVMYVARQFSVPEFGLFSFAVAVNAYIFIVSNFGLPLFGCRAVAKAGSVSRDLVVQICWSRACLSVLATLLVIGMLAIVPGISRLELQLVALFGIANFAQAGLFDWAFQGLHQQEISAILNVLWQGGWLALTIAGVRLGFGVRGVAVALFASALVASAVGYVLLRQSISFLPIGTDPKPLFQRSWEMLKSAAPLGWGNLLITVIVWSDVVLVRSLCGGRAAGLYAAGNRGSLALAMLASMYVQGAFPLLSRISAQGTAVFSQYFQRCYEDMALCFLPGSVWVIVYAPEIILAVFKRPEYLAAVPVFRIFQVIFLLTAFWNLYSTGVLIAFQRDRDYQRVLAMTAVAFLPLCFLLTLLDGAPGASLAVLLAQAFCLFAFMAKSRALVHARHVSALLMPLLVGLAVSGVSKIIRLSLFPSAALLLVAYIGILVARFRGTYLARGAWQV
jgi:O-antigen/teichoic acid export membrane protein